MVDNKSNFNKISYQPIPYSNLYNYMGLILFVVYFAVYVVSNIKYFGDVDLYWGRHIVVILAAIFSLFSSYKKALFCLFLLFPLVIVYIIGGQYIYSSMVICTALSSPLLGFGINYGLHYYGWRFPALLLFISSLPIFIDMDTIVSSGLFNTGYGRERMDIGYIHPKEGAAPLLISFILLFLTFHKNNIKKYLIIFISVIVLILISSRNAFLYFLIFLYFSLNNKILKIFAMIFLLAMTLYTLQSDNIYSTLDDFSSERISGWIYSINNVSQVDSISLASDSRFGADSFFIESYLMAGIFGIFFIFLWLILIYLFSPRKKYENYNFISYFLGLIFYSFIDTGIASSGNLVHLFSWSVISFLFCNKLFNNK